MSLSALVLICSHSSTAAQTKGKIADLPEKIRKVPVTGVYFSRFQMDANKDGKVTRDEFLIYLSIFKKTRQAAINAAKLRSPHIRPK